MAPFKAPGVDGFPAAFYQNTWNIVGDSLYRFTYEFMESSYLPEGTNDMLLVLIPKTNHPKQISHFRPISLRNVNYKVVTKTMSNRLKEIMKSYIAPNQNSFVSGRQIVALHAEGQFQERLHAHQSRLGESL